MNSKELMRINGLRLRLLSYCVFQRRIDYGRRLDATRKLFGNKVFAVDIHTHSLFSDGKGTVQENYDAAMRCGLDFIFMTDHGSLGQKRKAVTLKHASWGQEPGAGLHHIGLLQPKRKFVPKTTDIKADFERAGRLAPFVWIPHPAGWYHQTWYNDEQIESLWRLGDLFAVEVLNGAARIETAYDEFDRKAVAIWDQLLCEGRKITALGGSDAHSPELIGTAWTGIYGKICTANSLIKALNEAKCFASEAAFIDFSIDGKPMGTTVKKRKGSSIELDYMVVDSDGLAKVEIVHNGDVVHEAEDYDSQIIKGKLKRKITAKPGYYRLQSTSADKRRAFSSPVYVEAG